MGSHNTAYELEQASILVPVGESPTQPTILYGAGAPTDGTSGTGLGKGVGSLYIDVTNAKLYINTNTAASPTWTVVGAQTT